MEFRAGILAGTVAGCMVPAIEAAPRPEISAIVEQVSKDSLEASLQRLVAFKTRFAGSDSNTASTFWMLTRLGDLGYDVRLDNFQFSVNRRYRITVDGVEFRNRFVFDDLLQWNVVGVSPGTLYGRRKVVVGAHYDSISLDLPQDEQGFAPGSDDDATGVAALLEVARVLKDFPLDIMVEFVLFGAEELGLNGSRAYVSDLAQRGDQVELMLQLDSIGSRSDLFPEAFTVDTVPEYLELGEMIARAAEDYTEVRSKDSGDGSVQISEGGCGCSDNQSFLDAGYPALGVSQFIRNPTPHLNTSQDTLGLVDVTLVEEITKAILASVLEIGGFPALTPDFDGNGEVEFEDFVLFGQAFGAPAETGESFDLDRDGYVGFGDFVIFAQNYGRQYSPLES